MLERFLPADDCARLRPCFAAQHALGPLDTLAPPARAAADAALADGARWVLKPQREGGGNNLYGAELSQFLAAHR